MCRCGFALQPQPPFRLDLSVWALRRDAANVVDRWDGTSYRRALAVSDTTIGVSASQTAGQDTPLAVTLSGEHAERHQGTIETRLEQMLGLEVDLSEFHQMAATDVQIGPLVARARGLKPPRFPTLFEALLNAVALQQLSLRAGLTLLNRLASAYGGTVSTGEGQLHAFPRPDALAALRPQALRELGFSLRKGATVIQLSQAVVGGHLDLEHLERFGDDEVVSRLTRISGIGRWSAEYALLRGLGRLHIFPGDDVGARNNLMRLLDRGPLPDYATVQRAVARWQPYAGMVYFHLLIDRILETEDVGASNRIRDHRRSAAQARQGASLCAAT
jgi:DNA-3-methyladenine glycosylase II